jgi:arylsulfatase A-like enzyme
MKVLLLVLRGLQTAMLSPYGNRWIDTPNFDLLAEAGTVFDWHFANHPEQPLLSQDGEMAALREAGNTVRLLRDRSRGVPPEAEPGEEFDGTDKTLQAARRALRAGWQGLLIVELAALLPPWKIGAPFLETMFPPPELPPVSEEDEEEQEDEEDQAALSPQTEADAQGLELLPEEEPLEPVLRPLLGPIDPTDDHMFLCIQSTYAAAVMHLDARIAELLDGLPDDVTLLVTSDAGFPLGEHGHLGPGGGLHEEWIHLPLLAVGPGIAPGSRRRTLTAASDLPATLAARFGLVRPGLDLLSPQARREAVLIQSVSERGLRTEQWYLRVPALGEPQLYEKPCDRSERLNLAQVQFAQVEELLQQVNTPV